ncbi:hypothetical protein JHK87_050052 [Glycine soja]|nr:hypothetical protein JHK87_050052 [Glycine soja]
MENSSEEEFDEDDELAFISTKIRKMCKNKKCPELEKSKDKYKHFKSKDKKSLMSTWEDLDDTTSDEEGEDHVNDPLNWAHFRLTYADIYELYISQEMLDLSLENSSSLVSSMSSSTLSA